MTIHTLIYIHKMLENAVEQAGQLYKNADILLAKYKETSSDLELIKRQQEAVDQYYNAYSETRIALEEFEATDW